MTIYYSPSNEGFYDTDLVSYPSLPQDVITVTKEQRDSAIAQMNTNNKKLVFVDDKLVLEERNFPVTWKSVRDRRNQLLDNSDYTQITDFPGDSQAWSVYRQTLRDIPQKYQNPEDVVWPAKPKK